MKTYFDDLALFEAVKPTSPDPKKIRIFDFDGTIFNSPNPNPELWDKKTIGKLRSHFNQNGYGWYQNTLTLDDKYIDLNDFNEDVVREVESSMKDPNSVTVLLTGRTTDYLNQVKKIVATRGLVFDEYGLKPSDNGVNDGSEFTMEFKKRFINELIDKYENVTGIEMWDDRFKHVTRFNDFLDSMDMNMGVHHVNNPDKSISDPNLERELVSKLMDDPRIKKNNSNKHTPIYKAAFITKDSRAKLLSELKDKIPDDWRIYAHHMTMLFGKKQNDMIQKYIDQHIDTEVKLNAIELGISPDAMAVKIESDVPTDNKIPHVTIAVPKGGKPVNSNNITNWERLEQPIEITATIGEFFG